MFLKKNKYFFLSILIFLISNSTYSKNKLDEKVINYLNNIKNFSVSFVQYEGLDISEGNISIGDKRIRVDYSDPSEIVIILSENKAMYYNKSLDDTEFFDPKNTFAWFFFEIFKSPEFLTNQSTVSDTKKNIVVEKKGFNKEQSYKLRVIFENDPMVIRKIELETEDLFLILSLFNHKYNNIFEDNFFKLINPSFF